jgi:hypothetical protein
MNPRTITGWTAAALLALMGGAGAMARDQDAASAAALGQATLTYDFAARVPAKDRPAMVATAKAVAAVVMATPSLSRLTGVAVNGGVHSAGQPTGAPPRTPHAAYGPIILRKINLPVKARANAQGRYEGEGEGPIIPILINTLYLLPGNAPAPAWDETFGLPTDLRSRGGVTRFAYNGWSILVVHRPDALPFVHVTRQELLTRAMAALRPDSPQLDDKRRARIQAQYDILAAELAGLTPRQRAEPGCENGRIGRQYSKSGCDVPGATYIVRYNPTYFDLSRPPTAPQIVSLRVRGPWAGSDPDLTPRLQRAFDEIDVTALQALIAKR